MRRIQPSEYQQLDLRAHSLLADVPLHDAWAVDLPGGGTGRTVLEIRDLLSVERLARVNPAVRMLFGLRARLGQLFGWDGEAPGVSDDSFVHRLSETDRESSLVPPGTPDGPFRTLYVSPREAISEIQNATVHAFSVFALEERPLGYRFYWGIHVRPVGRLTAWYMRLIDPFRRFVIYPAVLRHLRAQWPPGVAVRD